MSHSTEPHDLEEVLLPIESIRLPALEIRHFISPAKIEQLAQSLQTIGQLHRIGVRPIPGDGYELIYGERRLRAARMLGWQTIRATVFAAIHDDKLALAIHAAENLHTVKLHPLETITILREFKSAGFGDQALARILSQPCTWLQNHLAIMRDPLARAIAETAPLLDAATVKNFMALAPQVRGMLLETAQETP